MRLGKGCGNREGWGVALGDGMGPSGTWEITISWWPQSGSVFGTHLMSEGAQQFCHSGGKLGIKGQGLFPIRRYLSLGVPHPAVPSPQSLLTCLPAEFPFLPQQSRRS